MKRGGSIADHLCGMILLLLVGCLGAAPARSTAPAGRRHDAAAAAAKPIASVSPALSRADIEPWLDGFMALALPRSDIAGAVVAVVKGDQVVLTKGYGFADVERRIPVDADRHLFRVASITKLFTWTAILQQVEQGRIDLDVDINRYLDFKIPAYQGKPLTMRNLMTHSTGFELVMRDLFSARPVGADLGATVKHHVPARIYPPGTTPTYSNYAPALAGYILERVSGEPFDSYIEHHILAPLRMTRSSTRQPLPPTLAPSLSRGYMLASAPPFPYEYTLYRPAGALAATAPDMARFMIAHLNDGALGSARLLRPGTARMMHRRRLALLPPLNGMMLGFYQHDINGHRVIVHDGDTRFFHSQLNLFIDDHVGIFVSVNSTGRDDAADILRTALFTKFADRYFPAIQIDPPADRDVAIRHASAMVGRYEASDRSATNFLAVNQFRHQLHVYADDNGDLVIPDFSCLDGAPKRWREIRPFVWREVNGKDRLAAQIIRNRPVRFSVDEYAPMVVWDRVPWWQSDAWLEPLSRAAFVVLLLDLVARASGLALRRYRRTPAVLAPCDRRRSLCLWLAALAGVVVPTLWLKTIEPVMTFTADPATIGFEIIAASALSLLAYLGGLLLATADAWIMRHHQSVASRLWSVALIASFAVLAWTAYIYKLLSFSTNF